MSFTRAKQTLTRDFGLLNSSASFSNSALSPPCNKRSHAISISPALPNTTTTGASRLCNKRSHAITLCSKEPAADAGFRQEGDHKRSHAIFLRSTDRENLRQGFPLVCSKRSHAICSLVITRMTPRMPLGTRWQQTLTAAY